MHEFIVLSLYKPGSLQSL